MNEILKSFCATINDSREYLRAPFVNKGFIYATNGHIAVRIPDNGTIQENKDAPKNIHNYFQSGISDFIEIPALPEKTKCVRCCGTGNRIFKNKCDKCDGKGEFYHGSHYYDCAECDGSGEVRSGEPKADIPCEYCDGSGWEKYSFIDIGEFRFQCAYIEKILALPNVKFMRTINSDDACKFLFDGGEGIIMPMHK